MEKSRISRRGMLKGAAAALLALDGSVSAVSSAAAAEQLPLVQKTPVIGSKNVTGQKVEGSVAKVYFSPVIDAASLIKLYNLVNEEIYGKVAIKLHTGEPHGPNILPRDMVQALQKTIPNSTIVETNTLYGGGRQNTADHRKTVIWKLYKPVHCFSVRSSMRLNGEIRSQHAPHLKSCRKRYGLMISNRRNDHPVLLSPETEAFLYGSPYPLDGRVCLTQQPSQHVRGIRKANT